VLILNVLVWAVDALLALAYVQVVGEPHYYPLLEWGVKSNTLILEGQVWRLITPIFIHVGFVHLAFNTYALYMIAPQIECFFGPHRFLIIYMLSGIYGVLFSFALSPAPSAGASGAILGLIGTQAAFFYRYRNAFGERGRRQFYGTVAVIAINMVLTFSASGIDIWGHLGGLFVGAVLGWTLMPRYALVGENERSLIDLNDFRRWGIAVGGAILVLVISAWLTIATQNTST
jgi:rhomboid protease GluP